MSKHSFLLAAGLILAALSGCLAYWARGSFPTRAKTAATGQAIPDPSREPIRPVPPPAESDPDKVALGHRLFHDRRLSGDDTISCAHCHDLTKGGTDRLSHSTGIDSELGTINTPTVFNSGLNFKQFWDGRAATLEDQIEDPIHDPKEMNSTWPAILSKLRGDPTYVASFASLYPAGIDSSSIKDAIATFERSLVTPDSRFDRYLRGDMDAIDVVEKEGYRLFKVYGCASCHQGAGVGGNMYARFGVMANYFADRGKVTREDLGRFNVTGKEKDRYRFKVPGLRNVALTAPYFHDGSAPTLEAAVNVMAKYQLGREIGLEDTTRIVRFLGTLTGEYQGSLLK